MKGLLTLLFLVALLALGYYYSAHKTQFNTAATAVNETKNAVVATTAAGIDAAIQTAVSGVDKISPIYYYENRSYGKSAAQNICNDTTSSTSVGAVIAGIQTYTKAVTCTVDPHFPSKSFTIIAASYANKGQYYCTDQSGYVGLISSVAAGSGFKAGLSCK